MTDRPICVTGATGLIGAHIVKQLLEKGHKVRATVRDPQAARCQFLRDMGVQVKTPGAELKLVKADLMKPGSFDEAMDGCEIVIHTAANVSMTYKECPFKEVVLPAVEGTREIARAAKRVKTIKRIVNTGSVSSLLQLEHEREPSRRGKPYNEDELRNDNRAAYATYQLAKQRSELVLNDEFQTGEVIHILPTWCMGPQLGPDVTSSHQLIKAIAAREMPMAPLFYSSFVDLRDVAAAHIHAAFCKMPEGYRSRRYIVSQGELFSALDFSVAIGKSFPHLSPPTRMTPWPLMWLASWFDARITSFVLYEKSQKLPPFDGTRITRELGFTYQHMNVDATVRDCVASLIAHKVLPEKK